MSTGRNAFNQSPKYAFTQSPHFARGLSSPPPEIEIQMLLQTKQWPGLGSGVVLGNNPSFRSPGYPDVPPTADWRLKVRRRFRDLRSTWTHGAVSYEGIHSYAGPGDVPMIQGFPLEIHGDPSVLSGENPFPAFPNPGPFNQDWDTEVPEFFFDWIEAYWTEHDPALIHADQSRNWFLSTNGEYDFFTEFSWLRERIIQRPYPTFEVGVFPERFNEYNNLLDIGSKDPVDYDRSPVALPRRNEFVDFIPPFGAPAHPENFFDVLASWWVYLSEDYKGGTFAISDALFTLNQPIRAVKTRFRTPRTTSYFIAEGMLFNSGGAVNFYPHIEHDVIHGASVVEQGTLTAGQIKDVGFYKTGADGYYGEEDFAQIRGGIACGGIRFCILGETPAQYTARTGLVLG